MGIALSAGISSIDPPLAVKYVARDIRYHTPGH
jgi:hypothetical protein